MSKSAKVTCVPEGYWPYMCNKLHSAETINLKHKPYQCRIIDNCADDTLGD